MTDQPTVRALSDAMGGEVSGIDLAGPIDDETVAWIETAFHDHQVLVFREQALDAPALAAFGRRFAARPRLQTDRGAAAGVAGEVGGLTARPQIAPQTGHGIPQLRGLATNGETN